MVFFVLKGGEYALKLTFWSIYGGILPKRYVKGKAIFQRFVTNLVCLRRLNNFIKTFQRRLG